MHSSRFRCHHRRTTAGFSIVELLVLMAIIALLIAIMIPSLNRAREQAIRIKCENNLRQLVGATLAYSTESNSYLPYPNWQNCDSIYTAAGWLFQPNGLPLTPQRVQTGVLWRSLRSAALYRCELDQGPFIAGSSHLLTSYMMNGAMCGFGNVKALPAFKVQKFRADAILFFEADERPLNAAGWNDGSNSPSEGTTIRHNRGTCVGVIDGHVDCLPLPDYKKLLNHSPGPLWCNPASINGH